MSGCCVAPSIEILRINIRMKSYLRYEPKHQFGVITSPQCNVQYDYTGNLAFTGAIQDVCVWNLRQASLVGNIDNMCINNYFIDF